MFGILFTGVFWVASLAYGLSLRRRKWLNTIAGNNFATKEDYKKPEQIALGLRVGRALVCASFLPFLEMISLICDALSEPFVSRVFYVAGLLVLVSMMLLVVNALVWSIRHMKNDGK